MAKAIDGLYLVTATRHGQLAYYAPSGAFVFGQHHAYIYTDHAEAQAIAHRFGARVAALPVTLHSVQFEREVRRG